MISDWSLSSCSHCCFGPVSFQPALVLCSLFQPNRNLRQQLSYPRHNGWPSLIIPSYKKVCDLLLSILILWNEWKPPVDVLKSLQSNKKLIKSKLTSTYSGTHRQSHTQRDSEEPARTSTATQEHTERLTKIQTWTRTRRRKRARTQTRKGIGAKWRKLANAQTNKAHVQAPGQTLPPARTEMQTRT